MVVPLNALTHAHERPRRPAKTRPLGTPPAQRGCEQRRRSFKALLAGTPRELALLLTGEGSLRSKTRRGGGGSEEKSLTWTGEEGNRSFTQV